MQVRDLQGRDPVAGPVDAAELPNPIPDEARKQLVQAISRAKQDEPIAKQTSDRGLFEAVAQIKPYIDAGLNHLVFHEDLQPFERWNKAGGWDPGVSRTPRTYDYGRLLVELDYWRKALS